MGGRKTPLTTPMKLVNYWEPTEYGKDVMKMQHLQNLWLFPFVGRIPVDITYKGQELSVLRPSIKDSNIIVPQAIVPKISGGFGFYIFTTGLEINDVFVLHTDCRYLEAFDIKYQWAENTFFKRTEDSWLNIPPTSKEAEIFKACMIMRSLSE